jgi:hypothetical protein
LFYKQNLSKLSNFIREDLFQLPTWCTIPLFHNICITLNTSTCFEQYNAHPQEVKIVLLQHLVSSFGRTVYRLRADCNPLSTGALYGRLQRVTIPDAVKIQFWPPEDEHIIARNMSRIIMWYIYYGIKELCINLVIETSLYYDVRSEKHQIIHYRTNT